ncbi:glycosyltransferase family 1 protein [Mesorhizobium sp. LHD-90]|uniref:glycosyltransferase family 4 protein n=1 Tax=Mesorhizobium sp. LHD-90 TaxID=3071414 RepID=UPI0027DF38FE|nr:glycosyltransferase family 1 protein [Mesorhizobium sp. LHD-90]MDQ6436699.1 glycosyltransferase family 1 protein [Mesorhizobium sp. LHD-90]
MRSPAAPSANAGPEPTGEGAVRPGDRGDSRILIVTDAWHPQVNGVVRTLQHLADNLADIGHRVEFLTPREFPTVPMPSYPDIRLALALPWQVTKRIEAFRPDHVHIATEGPLGILARRHCLRRGHIFTTSYHTRFPEYVRARVPIPESWIYRRLRRFHNSGAGTLVATPSLAEELTGRGFERVRLWTRGVDTELYRPDRRQVLDLPRPIFLSVGRIAVEKNLPAFLDLDLPGSKVVVGDGPALASMQERYPDTHFLGMLTGEALADIYASCDVFVFPSRTDTFGIVLLEALASGLPVAAYDVTGPADVFSDGVGGVLSEDLREAALAALSLDRETARRKATTYSWAACAALFMRHVRAAHVDEPTATPAAEAAPSY